jgi:hypothetical protein
MKKARKTIVLLTLFAIALLSSVAYAHGGMNGTFKDFPIVNVIVNGEEYKGEVPAINFHGKTMVPLRFVSETLGQKVHWNSDTWTVTIGEAGSGTNHEEESSAHKHNNNANDTSTSGHNNHTHHAMNPVEIPADIPAPTVKITVIKDPMSGWNLNVLTTHFRFVPEHVSGPNHPDHITEGHAHLFIDGKKVTRLYGPWYYIGELSPGTHEIKVSLNANNHAPFVKNGQGIATHTVTVEVQE